MPQTLSTLPLIRLLERHPRWVLLLALLAGVALVPAFAPFEIRVLGVLAPALLFLLWAGAQPRQAAWRGYVFGLGLFGAGVYWVYYSLHLFGAAIAPLAALITAGFVMLLALFPALLGYLVARLRGRTTPFVHLVVLVPALWVLFEWWRSWLLTGFPWLLLGTAQRDTALAGYLPVLGVFGTSLVAAMMAGALVWGVVSGPRRLVAALGLVGVLWLGGLGLTQVEWTRPVGEPLQVSLVQGNMAQEDKLRPGARVTAMKLYGELTEAAFGSDLILWPETAVPSFYHALEEDFFLPLAAEAGIHGGALLAGIFTYEHHTRRMFNSIVKVDADHPQFYHKRKRVPFGEYLPMRGWLEWLERYIELPMADLSQGHGGYTLEAAGIVLGASICYEDAFGHLIIRALPQAQMLVNVTNDAWFGDSIAPHQHLEIAQVRSLEAGRDMLRATNTGISAVIDHQGRIRDRSPQFQPHVLTSWAQPREGRTPYALWGNWLVVTGLMVLVAGLLLGGARRSRLSG
ncbi:apolipoprotein N-acyltransferase [Ectothiorhodospira magna]|uniref:Apolipoprotein N-acyltransferase n=1 Tax=Ectothiorhodospira magna TaxID=867345 RepID=A0A1H9EBG2_9GAMM|nr:apolipoprotein N-acyltransferase [Ectothiorhodospira magna]SEQ22927.1 apolipoprotein N-acyltransferase [Ectothiorhodospira magna]